MRNKRYKKWVALVLLATLVLTLTSCGTKKNKDEENIVHPINVYIDIEYPEDSGLDPVKHQKYKVEEGTSVVNALQIYCNTNNIPVNVETTTSTIHGINNIYNKVDAENDNKESKWMFKINGKKVKTSESETTLKKNDVVSWIYQ